MAGTVGPTFLDTSILPIVDPFCFKKRYIRNSYTCHSKIKYLGVPKGSRMYQKNVQGKSRRATLENWQEWLK